MTRRKLRGRPLLVASGVLLAAGCPRLGPAEPPVGNLMPPIDPVTTLCVEALPAEAGAVVEVNGVVASEHCVEVTGPGYVRVRVSAPGYVTQTLEVPFSMEMKPITVQLGVLSPEMEPVGNLMPPQRTR
jgi:hypothetical protein